MDIKFGNNKLKKLANDPSKCKKELGDKRGTIFLKRLNDLSIADTLEDVRNLPGRFHELTGNLKGQWACDLDHPYRLIFTPQEDPIPTNSDGQYLWLEITGVEILEIKDYH